MSATDSRAVDPGAADGTVGETGREARTPGAATGPRWVEGVRAVVGTIGEQIVYALIRVFGRAHRDDAVPWLDGPIGGAHIGARPYEETAAAEGLTLERHARSGGLVPDFAALAGPGFDPDAVDPAIRDFYERTAAWGLDTWATTYFPARLALWLLVTTISRRVDQLNFPLDGLDTAFGMTSEIVLLRRPDGTIRYTGWFRRLRRTDRAIYTGFYSTAAIPLQAAPCVKVVFPMPEGNATVLFRPGNGPDGSFLLESGGGRFGDVGFYRLSRTGPGRRRIWYIRTLRERFHLYRDPDGVVRCDHDVGFLGFRVLSLHYRLNRLADAGAPSLREHDEG